MSGPYEQPDGPSECGATGGREGESVFPGFRGIGRRRGPQVSPVREASESDVSGAGLVVAELVASRRALGVTQTEVALRMGTSQSAVARLETQRSDARVSTLERYAAALGHQLRWQVTRAAVEGDQS